MRIHSQFRFVFSSGFLCLILFAGGGCKSSSSSNSEYLGKTEAQVAAIQKGKAIYQTICIACHNPNPKLEGALGPAVHDATLELLEARILRAEYPAGYKPKRTTKQMGALPQYKNEIGAIYEYLQTIK